MDQAAIEKKLLLERAHIINCMMESSAEIQQRNDNSNMKFSEQAIVIDNLDILFKLDKASKLKLLKVNNALNRLFRNEYNVCICCGKTISEKRLLALPYTDRCIGCA